MERHTLSTADLFIDRSRGCDKLLIILAGYREFLWPLTLPRIAKFVPLDMDVCIASSGVESEQLMKWAETFQWSYLRTSEDKIGLVQNIAIDRHKHAHWIYKLDEDMFIAENYFESLLWGYQTIVNEGVHRPGFVSPLININGYTYVDFLKKINKADAYLLQFGELHTALTGLKAHLDGEAAKWLWRHSVPFDHVARKIAASPFSYTIVQDRFSIGAILIERDFLEEIGGFKVAPQGGEMGYEEHFLCMECLALRRPIIYFQNVFAGHFSYLTQLIAMVEIFPELSPLLLPD